VKKSKKGDVLWQCGMIGVVHTFGRDLSFNPHIHALVQELRKRGNRIISYDGNMVYFWYIDHKTEKRVDLTY